MQSKLKAKELLARHWDRTLPVDPKKIAELEDIIVEGNFNEASGKLEVSDRVKIFVNDKESKLRQRFTIAHELGHWAFNHGNSFRDSVDNFRISQQNPNEVAANKFAMELLMPEEAIKNAIEGRGISDINRLANVFEVSQLAMKIRLEQLGWI